MQGKFIIYEPGSIVARVIEYDEAPDIDDLQDAVEGYIEVVPYFDTIAINGEQLVPCVAFCNEEGKLNRMPINAHATNLWRLAQNGRTIDDVLVGPVLVVIGDGEFMAAL